MQDKREAGYKRLQIPWETVEFLDSKSPGTPLANPDKSLPLYAYVVEEGRETLPRAATPIAQSYVDIFIGGALDIDQEVRFSDPEYSFTAEALATTYDWSTHWVNDRVLPYRAHAHNPQVVDINNALLRHVSPEYLQGVRLPHPTPDFSPDSEGSKTGAHNDFGSNVNHRAPHERANPTRIKRRQIAPT